MTAEDGRQLTNLKRLQIESVDPEMPGEHKMGDGWRQYRIIARSLKHAEQNSTAHRTSVSALIQTASLSHRPHTKLPALKNLSLLNY